jgi:hypothetical protein
MHILFIACTVRFPAVVMGNPFEVYHLQNYATASCSLLEHQTGSLSREASRPLYNSTSLREMSISNLNNRDMPNAYVKGHPNQASEDVEMEDPDHEPNQEATPKHFTVAIDFGTTFSSVSFIALEGAETKKRIHPNQICSVEQYPHAPSFYYEQRREVPTESWYPKIVPRENVRDDVPMNRSLELTPNGSSEYDSDSDQHTISGVMLFRSNFNIPTRTAPRADA